MAPSSCAGTGEGGETGLRCSGTTAAAGNQPGNPWIPGQALPARTQPHIARLMAGMSHQGTMKPRNCSCEQAQVYASPLSATHHVLSTS